jgi:hypothetical protein
MSKAPRQVDNCSASRAGSLVVVRNTTVGELRLESNGFIGCQVCFLETNVMVATESFEMLGHSSSA